MFLRPAPTLFLHTCALGAGLLREGSRRRIKPRQLCPLLFVRTEKAESIALGTAGYGAIDIECCRFSSSSLSPPLDVFWYTRP